MSKQLQIQALKYLDSVHFRELKLKEGEYNKVLNKLSLDLNK